MTCSGKKRGKKTPPKDSEILNVDGAAEVLGVSRTTVFRLARIGKLPGHKVGRQWRFSRASLRRTISKNGNGKDSEVLRVEEEIEKQVEKRLVRREAELAATLSDPSKLLAFLDRHKVSYSSGK